MIVLYYIYMPDVREAIVSDINPLANQLGEKARIVLAICCSLCLTVSELIATKLSGPRST